MRPLIDTLPELRQPQMAPSRETRWRFRFSLLTVLVTFVLVGWGAFVTSIEAGLAVPDWPASFGSLDPFTTGFEDPSDPAARWWHSTPVLAEHGHRLLGALVGLLTVTLALWTWRADPRRWMRWLGFGAVALVIAQGVLGGLRVVWLSLNLAVVHAVTAQLFVSLLVAMTLFTSGSWLTRLGAPAGREHLPRLRSLAAWTLLALYVQILLGALLRHPGLSVDPLFATIHVTGAVVVTGLVFACFAYAWRYFEDSPLLYRAGWALLGIVALQFVLGLAAYVVILYEAPLAMRSVFQVGLTIVHVVVGSALVAGAVSFLLLALRKPVPASREAHSPGLTTRAASAPAESLLTQSE